MLWKIWRQACPVIVRGQVEMGAKLARNQPDSIDILICSLGIILYEVLSQQRVYTEERRSYANDYMVRSHWTDIILHCFTWYTGAV